LVYSLFIIENARSKKQKSVNGLGDRDYLKSLELANSSPC